MKTADIKVGGEYAMGRRSQYGSSARRVRVDEIYGTGGQGFARGSYLRSLHARLAEKGEPGFEAARSDYISSFGNGTGAFVLVSIGDSDQPRRIIAASELLDEWTPWKEQRDAREAAREERARAQNAETERQNAAAAELSLLLGTKLDTDYHNELTFRPTELLVMVQMAIAEATGPR